MGMYLRVSKKWQFSLDVLMIVVGTVIMGFSFSVFLEPNSITTGGFSGLSMIICELFSKIGVQWLSTSVVYLVLNVILFVFAVKALGKRFAIKAIVGILSFSGAMELFALLPINIQYETLISAVYGGAIMGVGLGIVVRFGGSTGGSDLVASIIRIKKPQFTMGRLVVMIDFVVIFLSLFVFKNGIELLPYTIMALLLSLWTTDFVNEGYKQVRAYSIITKKPEEVADVLMNKLSRGCTGTKVVGMHTKEEQY
ncbi:MAG: YitT family protein, partial [Clostridia bacterium]|nr:YitT family protein [Clostridia bacterium]